MFNGDTGTLTLLGEDVALVVVVPPVVRDPAREGGADGGRCCRWETTERAYGEEYDDDTEDEGG